MTHVTQSGPSRDRVNGVKRQNGLAARIKTIFNHFNQQLYSHLALRQIRMKSNTRHILLRTIAAFLLVGFVSGESQDESLGLPPAEESFSRDQVRSWSPYKVREVVGQLAETVEDLGKKLLEMPIEGPSGAPGPPGPRGLPVSSAAHHFLNKIQFENAPCRS